MSLSVWNAVDQDRHRGPERLIAEVEADKVKRQVRKQMAEKYGPGYKSTPGAAGPSWREACGLPISPYPD